MVSRNEPFHELDRTLFVSPYSKGIITLRFLCQIKTPFDLPFSIYTL